MKCSYLPKIRESLLSTDRPFEILLKKAEKAVSNIVKTESSNVSTNRQLTQVTSRVRSANSFPRFRRNLPEYVHTDSFQAFWNEDVVVSAGRIIISLLFRDSKLDISKLQSTV